MPEWIYRNTDAREDNQRDTVHFSAGKIWLHTKKNILFFSCWKISLLQVHIHVWNILLIKISIRYHIQFIKMAQQGKSAHIHLLQKELYYTETQHISFTHLSVLPISPDNNYFKKKKEKKSSENITSTILWGVIQSVVCHLADLFALSPKNTQASTTHLCPTIGSCTQRVHLLDQHGQQLLNQGSLWRQQG